MARELLPASENSEKNSSGRSHFLQGLWTSAGSARTAVFLLILLAISSALGTLITQNESRAFYEERYGIPAAKLILAASLDNVYSAWWFLLFLVLVATNLVVSNIKRLEILRRHFGKGRVTALGRAFFLKSSKTLKFTVKGDDERIRTGLEQALHPMGFRLQRESKGDEVFYLAEKGTLRRWGSLVTHTGILIVFLGVIYGHWPGSGFSGMAYMSPLEQDSIFELEKAGFSLKMLDTGSKMDRMGRPLDYYSRVEVQKDGKKMLEKTIRVNEPLKFAGVKFYQTDFGVIGFYLDIKGPDGLIHKVPVHLTMEGTPDMDLPVPVPGTELSLFLHRFYPDLDEPEGKRKNLSMSYINPAAEVFVYENFAMDAYNRWKAKGLVSNGNPLHYRNYIISMGALISYSGLKYRKDPGVPIVWAGFSIMILGLVMSFYLTEKTIRILILAGEHGQNLVIGTHSPIDESFDEEISALQKTLKES